MDANRFDGLARAVAAPRSRRGVVKGLLGGSAALVGAALGRTVAVAAPNQCNAAASLFFPPGPGPPSSRSAEEVRRRPQPGLRGRAGQLRLLPRGRALPVQLRDRRLFVRRLRGVDRLSGDVRQHLLPRGRHPARAESVPPTETRQDAWVFGSGRLRP